HNGSSLFNSDSGMVAIRKHIIENDYLEAIVALPTNMFYNTGIPTFIWIITNKKPEHKKGKVQLINATNEEYFSKMKKSLGSKQNEMTKEHIEKITKLFLENASNKDCKILDNEDFGYTKIIIEKPKSIEALKDDEKFAKLKDKDKILEKLEQL
ncbi:N-6 DNA methylase, partial [Campylobacter jejuni]